MFDLTWLPDWFLVFAGLLIALGAIAFLLTPFAVLGMRLRLARLEGEVKELRDEVYALTLAPAGGRPSRHEGWSAPQGEKAEDVSAVPWSRPRDGMMFVVEPRQVLGQGEVKERSRTEPRLRWPPPK